MNDRHITRYLIFSRMKHQDKKTYDVNVYNMNELKLGHISWRVGWRRYVFTPEQYIDFDIKCLKEIIDYIRLLMEER